MQRCIRPAPLTHRSSRIRQEHTHTHSHMTSLKVEAFTNTRTHSYSLQVSEFTHSRTLQVVCCSHTHTSATHTLALQGGLIDSSPDGGWQQLMFPLISSSCCLGQVTPTGAMVSTPRALLLHSRMAVCVCLCRCLYACVCLGGSRGVSSS